MLLFSQLNSDTPPSEFLYRNDCDPGRWKEMKITCKWNLQTSWIKRRRRKKQSLCCKFGQILIFWVFHEFFYDDYTYIWKNTHKCQNIMSTFDISNTIGNQVHVLLWNIFVITQVFPRTLYTLFPGMDQWGHHSYRACLI